MGKLNSKERFEITMSWKDPDRPPLNIYMTPEIEQKLQVALNGKDILESFEIDFRYVKPEYRGKLREPSNGVFYDIWGVGYRKARNAFGSYDEACELPLAALDSMDAVEKYPWPSVDDFDFSGIKEECEAYGKKGLVVCFGNPDIPDIVNGVSRGRGMEQVLMDIALEDEVGMAIVDKRVEFYYEYAKRAMEAAGGKIDVLCLGEDTGTQNGRLFSREVFDRVFTPRLKKFYDLAHNYGSRAMMHSCGDTSDTMPSFISMGLDILDAMQPEPEGMNPVKIREVCRGKLAFCGLISTQSTLPRGTAAQCRAEARHRLDVIAKGGGYIFAPAHCIQPDTPLENIFAIYEEALNRKII